MLLIGSYRLHSIIAQEARLSLELLNLRMELQNYQSYASSIADSTVSINDLMNAGPMFERMSLFMVSSHQAAMIGAQQKIGYTMAMSQANLSQIPQEYMPQYQQMLFKSLYDQERQKFAEVEKKLLNQKETKIQQRIAQIETRLQMLGEEKKNTREAIDASAKNAAPKYYVA